MNPISKLKILLLLLILSLSAISQKQMNNFALTVDVLGNGGLYSVNGEYKIGKINNFQVNARAGFGYYQTNNQYEFIGVPIGLNLLTGTKNHHLELGLGASYVKGLPFPYKGGNPILETEGIYFVPSIGYRYDKLITGLIFKVYYSPFIGTYSLFNKEKYITNLVQFLNGSATKEELLNNEAVTERMAYLSNHLENRFGYFGVTIGYRF